MNDNQETIHQFGPSLFVSSANHFLGPNRVERDERNHQEKNGIEWAQTGHLLGLWCKKGFVAMPEDPCYDVLRVVS